MNLLKILPAAILQVLLITAGFCQGIYFTESAQNLGIAHTYDVAGIYGGAATFYDFDMDGWDDVTLATGNGDSIHFYKNIGGTFIKLPSFVSFTGEAKSVLWVDFDNDGDKDLYISSYLGTNRLYENDGLMNFTDITLNAELPLDQFPSFGAAWADYDNDGWLDLYFVNRSAYGAWTYTNYLYRNDGDGTFSDVTTEAGVGDGVRSPLCAGFLDFNNDGWQDLYTACEMLGHSNSLFQNNSDGSFSNVSLSSGANIDIEAMCVAVGDYNNDSFLDIYVTNRISSNRLLMNRGDGTFKEVSASANVEMNSVGWSSWFFDADNDGDEDLYVSGSSPGTVLKSSVMYENKGDGTFQEADNSGMEGDTMRSYSNSIGDVNNDGFADILVLNVEPDSSQLWISSPNSNNWLKLQLEGTVSNRDGVGSWIDIYTDSLHLVRTTHCGLGFLGQGSSWVFVGLGTDSIVDSLIVKWPSGIVDKHFDVQVNQHLQLLEGEIACAIPISSTIVKKNVDCAGAANGELRALGGGGTAPYNYRWNTIPETTGNQISNLPGGVYSLRIQDSQHCLKEFSVNLFEPSPLFLTAITNFPNQGDINLLVSGGVAPYTYIWSTGATTEDVSGLSSGFYFVQVKDALGCGGIYSVQL